MPPADRLLHRGQAVERDELGGLVALLDRDILAELAGEVVLPVAGRAVAGHEKQVPHLDRADVVSHGWWDPRQLQPHFCEFRLNLHMDAPPRWPGLLSTRSKRARCYRPRAAAIASTACSKQAIGGPTPPGPHRPM